MEDNGEMHPTLENDQTPHLNVHGLIIRSTQDRGRGVYGVYPSYEPYHSDQTLIEVSPVLFFGAEEYESHGKYTVLDHYTFIWGDGRMALPLGLGSLFNHSALPNVNYIKKKELNCIEYWTTRTIDPGEELCIFYGHKLWFTDSSIIPVVEDAGENSRVDNAGNDILGVEW